MGKLDIEEETLYIPDSLEDFDQELDDHCDETAVVLDSDDDEDNDVASILRTRRCNTTGGDGGGSSSACKQWRAGYIRKGVYPVCTFAPMANGGFSSAKASEKLNSVVPVSIRPDPCSSKRFRMKDHETLEDRFSREREVQESVQHQYCWICNGYMNTLDDKTNKIQGLSKVQKQLVYGKNYLPKSKCKASDNDSCSIRLSDTDQETAKLRDSESQDFEYFSEALGFVDHYISLNDTNFSDKDAPRKISRPKSPPALCAKGPRSLAGRASLGTAIGSSRIFDWDDSSVDQGEENVLQKKDMVGIFDIPKIKSVTKNYSSKNLPRDDISTKFPHQVVQNTEVVDEFDQVHKMNFSKELDNQLTVQTPWMWLEAGDVGGDLQDPCDVGFDTQLAAEAMESLLYVLPPNSDPDLAHQDPANEIGVSSVGKGPHLNSGTKARRLKQTNVASHKLNERRSPSNKINKKELDTELLEVMGTSRRKRRKSLAKTDSNFVCPTGSSVNSCNSSYNSKQREENKDLERDNINKVGECLISPKSGKQNTFEQVVPGLSKKRNLSSTTNQTRSSSTMHLLEETEDQFNSFGHRVNGVPESGEPWRRKRKENPDMLRFPVVRRKRSKPCVCISAEAATVKVSQKQLKAVNLAAGICDLKVDVWSFPKGKRKQRNARQLYGTSFCYISKGGIGDSNLVGSPKRSQENSGSSSYLRVYVRRKSPLLSHGCPVQSSLVSNCGYSSLKENSEEQKSRSPIHCGSSKVSNCGDSSLKENSEEQKSTSLSHCGSSVMNDETTQAGQHDFEASKHCGSADNLYHMPSAMGANRNLEKPQNVNSNGNHSEIGHELCDQNHSRFSLMKELFSLGISESAFTVESKHVRRRRNMKNVCVLFSQNMDNHMIKKQKKILGKLGRSVASSFSDATHFVADKFARTKNMLEAIALGKPVVTHLWLDSCGQASFFVDEKNYILRDAKKEKEIGFSMPVSLSNARKLPLLKDQKVYMTPNIKPGKELIGSLVKAVHGEICSKAVDSFQEAVIKNETIPDDLLILSCEQDYALCAPFLERGAAIYSSELLLNGIVIQKLEFERHQIFKNHVKG